MKKNLILILVLATVTISSCISPKKLKEAEAKYNQLNADYLDLLKKHAALEEKIKSSDSLLNISNNRNAILQETINQLNKQIDLLKQNNNLAIDQLKNLQVISTEQSQSIKKSLENIGAKDLFIQDLQSSISRRDSLNLALVLNLKSALADINDQDIEIKIDKNVVFVDISDKLLFKQGSYDLSKDAQVILGKIAKVLEAQPHLEFMVEGHTDSLIQRRTAVLIDNWDLSVKRATTIVRLLQSDYGIDPKRITAAGKSQYHPISTNETEEGRAKNRRTRIVILPQLDQFFKLLERK